MEGTVAFLLICWRKQGRKKKNKSVNLLICIDLNSVNLTGSDCALFENQHRARTWTHIEVIFGFCAKSVCSPSQLGKRFGWAKRFHGNRSWRYK